MFVSKYARFNFYLVMIIFLLPLQVQCRKQKDKNLFITRPLGKPSPVIEQVVIHSRESESSDKTIARKGILVRYNDAKATIMFAHGFMCCKYDVGFLRNLFPQGQYNFLTFDFRGHGEDTQGQICTLGKDEAYDVEAAANFIRKHPLLQGKPVFAYAFSMGAVATIEAQSKNSKLFDACILDCPFDSSENVIKKCLDDVKFSFFGHEFNIPGKGILQKYVFHPYVQAIIKVLLKSVTNFDPRRVDTNVFPIHPINSIAKVSIPCFFIHCKKDQKIPIHAIKEMYARASGPKMLWLTNGRNHYDSYFYNPEKYIAHVTKFFEQVITGKWKNSTEQFMIEDTDIEI